MSTPAGGAFRGLLARPWQRAVVAELLAHDRVPTSTLLDHVPPIAESRGKVVSKIHRRADQRNDLRRMLLRLAEHGAVQLPGCLDCGTVVVTDRLVLERVALLQATNPATNPKAAMREPARPDAVRPDVVRPDSAYMPDRIAERPALRVVRDGEAS